MAAGITLNPSRIDRILHANNVDEATKMGLLDKIIDWFQGGVKRNTIEHLYEKIINIKSNEFKLTSETDRLKDFIELRSFVRPEHRDQFKYNFRVSENGGREKIGCEFLIADAKIYYNTDMSNFSDLENKDLFFTEKMKMDIEDSFRGENTKLAFETLKNLAGEHGQNKIGKGGYAVQENRMVLGIKVLKEVCETMPEDIKEMVLSKNYGDFGYRIRDLLLFANTAVQSAVNAGILKTHDSVKTPYADRGDSPASYTYEEEENAETTAILSRPFIYMEMMNVFEFAFDKNVDPDDPNSKPSGGSKLDGHSYRDIKSHNELTEAEFEAFEKIGISREILQC